MFGHTHQNRRRRRNRRLLDEETGQNRPIVREPVRVNGSCPQRQLQLRSRDLTSDPPFSAHGGTSTDTRVVNGGQSSSSQPKATAEMVPGMSSTFPRSSRDVASAAGEQDAIYANLEFAPFGAPLVGTPCTPVRPMVGVHGGHGSLTADLARFRSAMGMSPLERYDRLQQQLEAVTKAVQEDERKYNNVVAQIRSDQESFEQILAMSDSLTSNLESPSVDLHSAAAAVLQPESDTGAKRLKCRGIDSANVLSAKLRDRPKRGQVENCSL